MSERADQATTELALPHPSEMFTPRVARVLLRILLKAGADSRAGP